MKAKEYFIRVYMASSKYERGWEDSRKLCKLSAASRVCITGSNSLSPHGVWMKLCKHRKSALLLNWKVTSCEVSMAARPVSIVFTIYF